MTKAEKILDSHGIKRPIKDEIIFGIMGNGEYIEFTYNGLVGILNEMNPEVKTKTKDFIHIDSRLPKVDGIYEVILFEGRKTRVKFTDNAFRLIQNNARVENVKYWKEKTSNDCGEQCLEGYKQKGTIVVECEDCLKDPALLNAKSK